MTVSFDLPSNLEQALRSDLLDLNAEAREAFLVDLYRRGILSHPKLSQALGVDRIEAETILHKHNVIEDLGTVDDYLAEAKTIERLRKQSR